MTDAPNEPSPLGKGDRSGAHFAARNSDAVAVDEVHHTDAHRRKKSKSDPSTVAFYDAYDVPLGGVGRDQCDAAHGLCIVVVPDLC